MDLIRQETSVAARRIAIYKDNTRSVAAMLPTNYTLEKCGVKGGPIDQPEELELFYDFKTDYIDCPLLMCDHYFVKDN
jgi:hypothetical protein